MQLRTLRVRDLRSVAETELGLSPGLNLLLGPNGAGKTSVLEAVYLMARGRSFRTRHTEVLVRHGQEGLAVFAEVIAGGTPHRLGLGYRGGAFQLRIDEADGERLSNLFAFCAACCFEPGSHGLLNGAREERRAFVDWGVFHMEPRFAEWWRRYQRALRQRNAALKCEASDVELDAWDAEMVAAGEPLAACRLAYLQRFEPIWSSTAALWLPELGAARLRVDRGWPPGLDLAQALVECRALDRRRQVSSCGPHRFDWRPGFDAAPQLAHLSRGQAKLTALAAVLAQARVFESGRGEPAVLLLDDLPSELDELHQQRLLATVVGAGPQVLLTATHPSAAIAAVSSHAAVFHVEHGRVARVREA